VASSGTCPSIRLVVFDWAGTTVDHGCFAPVTPFREALRRHGVEVSIAEARAPMGLQKRDHLRAILRAPDVAARWRASHQRDWTEDDVSRVYEGDFVPLQLECVERSSELVPGLLETVASLRARGIKIGTSTGYFAEAAELAYAAAARQGYVPDYNVHPGMVSAGRPAPWMIFRNMEALGVYPPAAVLKIGDTIPDVEEGLAAGVWSVGVTRTGSDVGLTAEAFAALPAAEQQARLSAAAGTLRRAGAHAVIPSVQDLPDLIDHLETEGGLPGVA
jgi:phosphonoacetaldehyde hydrolase